MNHLKCICIIKSAKILYFPRYKTICINFRSIKTELIFLVQYFKYFLVSQILYSQFYSLMNGRNSPTDQLFQSFEEQYLMDGYNSFHEPSKSASGERFIHTVALKTIRYDFICLNSDSLSVTFVKHDLMVKFML